MEDQAIIQLEEIAISTGNISDIDESNINPECCADYCPNDIDCSPECACDKSG